MKDAYYFSHDANARHDEKILEMRAELGWEGYGLFWAVIECLRESTDYKYSLKRLNGLALQLGTSKSLLETLIKDYGLFRTDEEYFWSESLINRMAKREEKERKAKESAMKRWALQKQNDGKADAEDMQCDTNANAMQTHNECNADSMQGKESKGKEIKEKEKTVANAPEGFEKISESVNPQQKDFPAVIYSLWCERFRKNRGWEYSQITPGVDRKAIGKILAQYKLEHPEHKSTETTEGLRLFFDKCLEITDSWFYDNMNPMTIASKYNSIKSMFNKNGVSKNGAIREKRQLPPEFCPVL